MLSSFIQMKMVYLYLKLRDYGSHILSNISVDQLCCSINEGAIYYGETRRRESILFTEDLREKVYQACIEMHQLYEKGYTPKAKMKKGCNACSLKEICVPQLMSTQSVDDYIKESL